jgi:hypothetical protein
MRSYLEINTFVPWLSHKGVVTTTAGKLSSKVLVSNCGDGNLLRDSLEHCDGPRHLKPTSQLLYPLNQKQKVAEG